MSGSLWYTIYMYIYTILWYRIYAHIYILNKYTRKQLLWSQCHVECHSPQPEVVQLHLCADYAYGISDTHYIQIKKIRKRRKKNWLNCQSIFNILS